MSQSELIPVNASSTIPQLKEWLASQGVVLTVRTLFSSSAQLCAVICFFFFFITTLLQKLEQTQDKSWMLTKVAMTQEAIRSRFAKPGSPPTQSISNIGAGSSTGPPPLESPQTGSEGAMLAATLAVSAAHASMVPLASATSSIGGAVIPSFGAIGAPAPLPPLPPTLPVQATAEVPAPAATAYRPRIHWDAGGFDPFAHLPRRAGSDSPPNTAATAVLPPPYNGQVKYCLVLPSCFLPEFHLPFNLGPCHQDNGECKCRVCLECNRQQDSAPYFDTLPPTLQSMDVWFQSDGGRQLLDRYRSSAPRTHSSGPATARAAAASDRSHLPVETDGLGIGTFWALTRDGMIQTIQDYGKRKGFKFIHERTAQDRIDMVCEHYGEYVRNERHRAVKAEAAVLASSTETEAPIMEAIDPVMAVATTKAEPVTRTTVTKKTNWLLTTSPIFSGHCIIAGRWADIRRK